MMIINAGSENTGGTAENAVKIAKAWDKDIQERVKIKDVVLVKKYKKLENGNFQFTFKHTITGVEVNLDTHGFSDEERKEFTFSPRIYWNGSSCGGPDVNDFLKDGYEVETIIKEVNKMEKR